MTCMGIIGFKKSCFRCVQPSLWSYESNENVIILIYSHRKGGALLIGYGLLYGTLRYYIQSFRRMLCMSKTDRIADQQTSSGSAKTYQSETSWQYYRTNVQHTHQLPPKSTIFLYFWAIIHQIMKNSLRVLKYSKNWCPWESHTSSNEPVQVPVFMKTGASAGAGELELVWITHGHWFLLLSHDLI